MSKDIDYNKLIHSQKWRNLRLLKLSRAPLCEKCKEKGLIEAATEVHHITPVEDALSYGDKYRLMFSPSNLLSLCHSCHAQAHREIGARSKEGVKRKTQQNLAEFRRIFFGEEDEAEDSTQSPEETHHLKESM